MNTELNMELNENSVNGSPACDLAGLQDIALFYAKLLIRSILRPCGVKHHV